MIEKKVGQIWNVKGSSKLSIIVFISSDSEGHVEDLRVIPVYQGHYHLATPRDIVIPAEETSLRTRLLATCWNSRKLEVDDLEGCVGDVSSRVVEALRLGELIGIAPVEIPEYTQKWAGRYSGDRVTLERQASFQRKEVTYWNMREETLRRPLKYWKVGKPKNRKSLQGAVSTKVERTDPRPVDWKPFKPDGDPAYDKCMLG